MSKNLNVLNGNELLNEMWYLYMLFLEREIRKNLSERLVRLLIII